MAPACLRPSRVHVPVPVLMRAGTLAARKRCLRTGPLARERPVAARAQAEEPSDSEMSRRLVVVVSPRCMAALTALQGAPSPPSAGKHAAGLPRQTGTEPEGARAQLPSPGLGAGDDLGMLQRAGLLWPGGERVWRGDVRVSAGWGH